MSKERLVRGTKSQSPNSLDEQIGHAPWRSTNKNLIELLRHHFGFELRDIFATNVFPFVKKGDMSASIPKRDLVRAAKDFAIPQIEIVEPLIAVCLGVPAYNALRAAVKIANLEQGIAVSDWNNRSVVPGPTPGKLAETTVTTAE